jgi:NAD dependent epimerase/dehydratase family enzyme
MRILVTGGTGVIGRPLVAALVAGGHSVVVLTRNPAKVKGMDANVQLVAWDGRTADGWSALVDGADAIVNLAGEGIADGRWSLARKKAIRESRVNAGAAIVEAVEQAAVKPKVVV